MNPHNFSLLFFSFCAFFISVLIWLNRGDRIGWRYLVFSSFVSVWGIGLAIMISNSVSKEQALFWGRAAEMAAAFIPATWIHFVSCYLKEEKEQRNFYVPFYIVAIVCEAVAVIDPPLFIKTVDSAVGFLHYFRPGPVFHLYTAAFIVGIPYGFFILFRSLKRIAGEERTNLKGFMAATFFGFLGASPTFLPLYEIMMPQYGLFILPIYPFVMAYFMMRKNLFDEKDLFQAAHRDKLAAIGTIATSINHEIRNPLYIIHGLAESFLHNFRGEEKNLQVVKNESVAVLEKTAQQAKRAMEIMSLLSLFAKHKSGEVAAGAEKANFQECLNNVLPLVRHEMTLDKISFESDLPDDLPSIKANPRQIEEILFNLLVNACQALKAEGGNVKISASVIAEKVIVKIEDDGLGIPQQQLKKIFDPFYTTKDEGTGLGLYIVKQLVEKNGGKINAESDLGSATCFSLEFQK